MDVFLTEARVPLTELLVFKLPAAKATVAVRSGATMFLSLFEFHVELLRL